MSIFLVQDEGPPCYLPCTGISRIEWSMAEVSVCQYCGTAMKGSICSGCGNIASPVSEHSLGRAVVMLEGLLPQATPIFYLPEGAELLLCHKCSGSRCDFDEREVIMRFLYCRQVTKYMPNVAALHPEQEDRLKLFVGVSCEVELYPERM